MGSVFGCVCFHLGVQPPQWVCELCLIAAVQQPPALHSCTARWLGMGSEEYHQIHLKQQCVWAGGIQLSGLWSEHLSRHLCSCKKVIGSLIARSGQDLGSSSLKEGRSQSSVTAGCCPRQDSTAVPSLFIQPYIRPLSSSHWPFLKEKWPYLGLTGIPRDSFSIWHPAAVVYQSICGSMLGSDTENIFSGYLFSLGKGKTSWLSCLMDSVLQPSHSSMVFLTVPTYSRSSSPSPPSSLALLYCPSYSSANSLELSPSGCFCKSTFLETQCWPEPSPLRVLAPPFPAWLLGGSCRVLVWLLFHVYFIDGGFPYSEMWRERLRYYLPTTSQVMTPWKTLGSIQSCCNSQEA